MYGQYRSVEASLCLELPDDVTAAEGAAPYVNPMTVLGMVETMRLEQHHALVHTAAASNLGQMLNRLCLAEAIPLVNIVRKPEQEEILRSAGATFVCNSTAATFMTELIDALKATKATLAFDAIGGGKLASQILTAMEAAADAGGRDLQPVRVVDPQAGLHLRRPRPRADRAHAQLRHGLGHRRVAAPAVPATNRSRRRGADAPSGRCRDENHVRQHLRGRGVIGGRPHAGGHGRLRSAGDRIEVLDQTQRLNTDSQP